MAKSGAASKSPTSVAAGSPLTGNSLSDLQGYSEIAVSFTALMVFDYGGTDLAYPGSLIISPVTIAWTGDSFAGKLEESAAAESVTETVDGTVSADGTTLSSLTYARESSAGQYYQVALQNVPLISVVSQPNKGVGVVAESGADDQQYFADIEYTDSGIAFRSVVWMSTAPPPVLTVMFGKAGAVLNFGS